jgi:glutamine synthetase
MNFLKSPKDILSYIDREKIEIVDLRYTELSGRGRHVSIPARELDEQVFQHGFPVGPASGTAEPRLPGSRETAGSVPGVLLLPVPESAFTDPYMSAKTLVLICDTADPGTGERLRTDSRSVIRRAVEFLRSSGIGDAALVGFDAEFYIFDDIRFDQKENMGFYYIDSQEGRWNSGRPENPNLGYKPRDTERGAPVPPVDTLHDIRSEMLLVLERAGILTESHRHGPATGGHAAVTLRPVALQEAADNLPIFKYLVRTTAKKLNRTVTFMPQPLYDAPGNGLNLRFSIWKDRVNLFAGDRYAGLSETGLYAIGGVLAHLPALLAFTCPTTGSYKRLVSGTGGPAVRSYSRDDPSAAVSVPAGGRTGRVELRFPDPSVNPYLAIPAVLMAMIDGIRNRIDPGAPARSAGETGWAADGRTDSGADRENRTAPEPEPEPATGTGTERRPESFPTSLRAALEALDSDRAFLLEGGVFDGELIKTWIEYKTVNEVLAIERRPHPWEFAMYYDI